MPRKKGAPKVPGSGRQKGTPNRVTREFKDLVESLLFDDVDTTRDRLIALRDSDEPTDRKTFWSLAAKLLPQKVDAKLEDGPPLFILEQDFVTGKIQERSASDDENDESDRIIGRTEEWDR